MDSNLGTVKALVLAPTRGRPASAERLWKLFQETKTCEGTSILFAIDDDDPDRKAYEGLGLPLTVAPRQRLAAMLNRLALEHATKPDAPFAIGFMGDDHIPRTRGWDEIMLTKLQEMKTGVVYANDLFQGSHLPATPFMSADIIRALGYMHPPTLVHLVIDAFWKEIAESIDRLAYMPDVIVEHLHPYANKAEWDALYIENNQATLYESDAAQYKIYKEQQFQADVAKVRALL